MFRPLIPLSEEQRAVQETARQFALDELAPHAARWDEESHFEPSLIPKLAELGLLGMMIPEEYGGLGLDTRTFLIALEEIAAVDASVAVMMSVHNSLPAQMILKYGSEAQKQRFLPGMASGEILGAFAMSEPEAGSDAVHLRTQAAATADGWVVDGTKAWVSSGSHAGVIVVLARTDRPDKRQGSRGVGAFLVTPDLPGFSVGKKEDKMGLRASPTVRLAFDRMAVPNENLLGDPSMGFIYAMESLEHGRLGIAAQAVGIARAALEHSVRYAGERRQFDRPIREFQAIQFKLADMATRVEASRALLHDAAAAKDRGESTIQYSAMSKLLASETAMWVTTQAIQIFGGYGYVKEYPVERLFRDAKVTEIYEGTSEIQRLVIAKELYR
jgi:alkylation response protein AidB-like acyl-CoA dehydrogenase